jgi:cell division septation protein DedD
VWNDHLQTPEEVLNHARRDVHHLNQRIEDGVSKNQAAVRSDLEAVSVKAKEVAASLKASADSHGHAAHQHLLVAAAKLEEAAKHAQEAAKGSAETFKEHQKAALSRAHDAAVSLSPGNAFKPQPVSAH